MLWGTISCKKDKELIEGKTELIVSPKIINTDSVLTIRIALNNDNGSKCDRVNYSLQNIDDFQLFKNIKLCNITGANFKTAKITYQDEPLFVTDGSNGEVMIQIPKVYFKRHIEGNYEFISLSPFTFDGFKLDPAFIEDGKELEYIYIGVYDGIVIDSKLRSISGVKPSSEYGLTQYRQFARNNGNGFGILDARSVLLIQRLFMCYYADRNSQAALGMGITNLFWQSSSVLRAINNEDDTNRIILNTGYNRVRDFKVGQFCAVAPLGEYGLIEERVITNIEESNGYVTISFSGDPVIISKGISKIYGQVQKTGYTDSFPLHHGNSVVFNSSRESGIESIKFLHIENIWGNVWNLIDGVFIRNLEYYVGENMSDYSSEIESVNTYRKLSYAVPHQNTNNQNYLEEKNAYVASLGFDYNYPAYSFPNQIGSPAGSNQGYSDPFYSYYDANILYYPSFGGGFDHSIRSGMFTWRFFWKGLTINKNLHGARLIYKNI